MHMSSPLVASHRTPPGWLQEQKLLPASVHARAQSVRNQKLQILNEQYRFMKLEWSLGLLGVVGHLKYL